MHRKKHAPAAPTAAPATGPAAVPRAVPKFGKWNRRIFAGWLILAGALVMTTGALKAELEAPLAPAALERRAATAALRLERERMLTRVVRSWDRLSFRRTPDSYFADHLELARNIMFEAGIEDLAGKLAVACVTMNRVRSTLYPSSLKDVIWQRAQFSWTHLPKYAPYRGKNWVAAMERTGVRQPGWKAAWEESKRAAAMVLSGSHNCGLLAGIFHYMNPDHAPRSLIRQWSRGYEPAFRLGRHVFWRKRGAAARQAELWRKTRPDG